jgi:hypothetical protein
MIAIITFLYLILVFVAFSPVEAANYKDFGKKNKRVWNKQCQSYSEYHKALWYVFFPLVCAMPALLFFFSTKNLYETFKLLLVCYAAYFVGSVMEDRFFFFINRMEFSPKTIPWFKKWVDLKILKVPEFYLRNLIVGIIMLTIYFLI